MISCCGGCSGCGDCGCGGGDSVAGADNCDKAAAALPSNPTAGGADAVIIDAAVQDVDCGGGSEKTGTGGTGGAGDTTAPPATTTPPTSAAGSTCRGVLAAVLCSATEGTSWPCFSAEA